MGTLLQARYRVARPRCQWRCEVPKQTPSQTLGPFFHYDLPFEGGEVLVTDKTRGERIRIEGRVIDGEGNPLDDALIEIWQANPEGRYDHPEDDQAKSIDPAFHGWGRCPTDQDGKYYFSTSFKFY